MRASIPSLLPLTLSLTLSTPLTKATPLSLPRAPAKLTTAHAFRLYVLPVPLTSDPPAWRALAGLHTGAAIERAVVEPLQSERDRPREEFSLDLVFYQNSTGGDACIVRDVLPMGYPMSLYLAGPVLSETAAAPEGGADAGGEGEGEGEAMSRMLELDITVAGQTKGLGIQGEKPRLRYEGAEGGWYMCATSAGLKGEEHMVVNWGREEEEGCTEVEFVPECAELPKLPQGALGSHEFAQEVSCYEDVMAGDWM